MRATLFATTALSLLAFTGNAEPAPMALTPMQAVEQAAANPEGVSGLFELTVRNTGTGTFGWETDYVFLNSETDYRDQRCLTVAITPDAVRAFKENGTDPSMVFKSQVIRVRGRAKRATIYFYSKGVKTDLYYFQTQVLVTSPDQITLAAADPQYPAHWWAPVSAEGAPTWEILPQAAGPGEVILSKRHELGLLSNFAATPFTFRGVRYASLEGFWQMMKYPEGADDPRAAPGVPWAYTRAQVAQLTAFEAKRAGDLASANLQKLGIEWVSFEGRRFDYRPAQPGEHYQLIVAATREKVRQNPEVQKVLLATGHLVLKPDHVQEPDAPAAWRYFDILTAIRTELQQTGRKPAAPPPGA